MSLPTKISQKYLARFATLISEGEAIQLAVLIIPGEYYQDIYGKRHQNQPTHKMDWEPLVRWKTNSISLLDQVIPPNSVHVSSMDSFKQISTPSQLAWGVSTLRGLADDLEHGFLSDVTQQIESAIASDYMGQAEGLLNEGQQGKFDHVPAAVLAGAVLAGAVLEKTLRSICEQHLPPIPTTNAKGEHKTLNPLIDDLKKAGVFNESKSKQLRAWAAIRNHAAHGEFDEFDRHDVEQMLQGIGHFLADYS